MSSYQTTMARAAASAAEADWRRHRLGCAQCGTAVRARKPDRLCPAGAELRGRQAETRAQVAREVAEDAKPVPGQGALFDLGEVAGGQP